LSSTPNNSTGVIRLFDILGMGASSLCMLHCLLMPVVAGFLPLIGARFLDSPDTHRFLAGFVILFCVFAIVPGYFKHRSLKVLLPMLAGLSLVLFATFACEELLGECWELPLISVGNLLVITAHACNRREHICDHHLLKTLGSLKLTQKNVDLPAGCMIPVQPVARFGGFTKPVGSKRFACRTGKDI
jgi:hypothetical protein